MKPTLLVLKLSDNATLPTRATDGSAGYDLYAAVDEIIAPSTRKLVRTDIAITAPAGCYARVAPRSGLALKHGIMVGAGVVDRDYRGEVGVLLFNQGTDAFVVRKGDRIAQLVLERIVTPPVVEVKRLESTAREDGGFGSTGK